MGKDDGDLKYLIEAIADAMSSIDNVPLFIADHSEIYDTMMEVQSFLWGKLGELNG